MTRKDSSVRNFLKVESGMKAHYEMTFWLRKIRRRETLSVDERGGDERHLSGGRDAGPDRRAAIGLTMKGERPAAIVDLQKRACQCRSGVKVIRRCFDTCGTGGDRPHVNISHARLSPPRWLRVAKHGKPSVSTSAERRVYEALGSPGSAAACC